MSTTDLFVELVVIGIGTAAWLLVLLINMFGDGWLLIASKVPAPIALIPILGTVYLLGIITDRLADSIFELVWGNKLIKREFGDHEKYYYARNIILTKSTQFSELLDYGRSRMRICRGWVVNFSVGIVVYSWWIVITPINPYLKISILIGGISILVSLTIATWFAWMVLTTKEYAKIKGQAGFLERKASISNDRDEPNES